MTPLTTPRIRKAQWVKGKTLVFRDAQVADAELILSLRTDPDKSRHLSATSADVEAQRSWLRQYASATDQAYFIMERNGEPAGTVRLYDARDSSFCWGSWIIADGQPAHVAIESALMVYAYGLDRLGFSAAHFDVRRANERVWAFHERFGAIRVEETAEDIFYQLDGSAIAQARRRYKRFLEDELTMIEASQDPGPC